MADSNHYEILNVSRAASQAEIKQAYRRLVKLFHPDSNKTIDNAEIIRINAAYEILGDIQRRQSYDRQQNIRASSPPSSARQQRNSAATQQYQSSRRRGQNADEQVQEWLRQVYQPVNHILCEILSSLADQIEELAADPFDDELLEVFQDYLKTCRAELKRAQFVFRSLPNPPSLAKAAAHLYYCLNRIGDGLEELEYFPLNYDERYLHNGTELFRIAEGLHCEARESVESYR
jgi:molecular chaperone DnaJ